MAGLISPEFGALEQWQGSRVSAQETAPDPTLIPAPDNYSSPALTSDPTPISVSEIIRLLFLLLILLMLLLKQSQLVKEYEPSLSLRKQHFPFFPSCFLHTFYAGAPDLCGKKKSNSLKPIPSVRPSVCPSVRPAGRPAKSPQELERSHP